MVCHGGGRSAPTYSQIAMNKSKEIDLHRFKKPKEVIIEDTNMGNIKPHEHRENHEEESREKSK